MSPGTFLTDEAHFNNPKDNTLIINTLKNTTFSLNHHIFTPSGAEKGRKQPVIGNKKNSNYFQNPIKSCNFAPNREK